MVLQAALSNPIREGSRRGSCDIITVTSLLLQRAVAFRASPSPLQGCKALPVARPRGEGQAWWGGQAGFLEGEDPVWTFCFPPLLSA